MSVAMVPKRSPMVSTWNQLKHVLMIHAAAVTMMMASRAPGRRLEMRGVSVMMSSDTTEVHSAGSETLSKLVKYMPHLGMNWPGMSLSPSPKKSLICVEKIVTAIPAVKPTTIG